eukprot:2830250-Prymnesium_polylepis.1
MDASVASAGLSVQVILGFGEYKMESKTVLVNNTMASEVWITRSSGSTISPRSFAEPNIFTVVHGSSRIHFSNLRLLGTLKVEEGHLTVTNCTIEA